MQVEAQDDYTVHGGEVFPDLLALDRHIIVQALDEVSRLAYGDVDTRVVKVPPFQTFSTAPRSR